MLDPKKCISKIEYSGYTTTRRYDEAENIYYGRIEGIEDLILIESTDPDDYIDKFHNIIDTMLV